MLSLSFLSPVSILTLQAHSIAHRTKQFRLRFLFPRQILSASLYIVDHLPEGAKGLWAVVNCESWCALGELEWVPFSVIKRAMEVNLLGKLPSETAKRWLRRVAF